MRIEKLACAAAFVMLFGLFPKECGATPDTIWGEIIDNKTEMKYFLASETTDEEIRVDKGQINPNFEYKGDDFEFDGNRYVEIPALARYEDGYRKEAVATITDGSDSLTVYDYSYPEGLHVLNISKFLYVREDELDEITKFYNEGPFTYQFVYYMPDWYQKKLVVEEFLDYEFDDELFLSIVNASPDVCEKMPKMVIRKTQVLYFYQKTADTDLIRSFEFYRVDGEFYVSNIRNRIPRDNDTDYHDCYHITDQHIIDILQDRVDWVNGLLLEKNYTDRSY